MKWLFYCVQHESRFGDELRRLCSDTSLCLSDTLLLPSDTFTFFTSSHDTVSWLDHDLSTTSGHSLFTNISVKSDFITFDHLPLCFSISIDNIHVPIPPADSTSRDSFSYNWYGAYLMLIFPIIIHAPELNLQRSTCLLMLHSVKM